MRIIPCEQGSREWADARRGRVTASRMGEILTPKTGVMATGARSYAYELIAESVVPPHYWVGNDYQSSPMANGTLTEHEARDFFAFDTGYEIEQVGFCVTDCDRFGASPDGLSSDGGGLELKCPLHKTQVEYLDQGKLPEKYRAQVHGSMIVTKRPHWWFMSYAPGLPPLILRVEPDDYTVKLAEALEKFWAMLTEIRGRIAPGDPVAATREVVPSYF